MLQLRFVGQDKSPVWLVESHYVLGSGSGCSLPLAGPGVRSRHAELSMVNDQLTVIPCSGAPVAVNELLVSQPTQLFHNSRLALGDLQLLVVDPKQLKAPTPVVTANRPEWCLVSTTTALANRRFPIVDSIVLGRAADCGISLGVAHLSRKHARLFLEGPQLWVEDLNSANGTFLNGERVKRAQLKNGDLLTFDTLVFSVTGGPVTAEIDTEKTSLRPALKPSPSVTTELPLPVSKERPAVIKARVSGAPSAIQDPSSPSAGWVFWAGLGLVGFMTVLVIIFLLN